MPQPLRALAALLSLLLATGLGVGLTAAPAAATSTRLCLSYATCAKYGMTSDGYNKVNDTMYWRMYAGHNCTNYAAYRMVRSGMPNVRPWSGSGNARNWGHAKAGITNTTPRVGAVAWWDAYVRPAGSAGHVAYVEQVISSSEIIVSQDSWGGDFSWARITRSGGSWPSGFIHFNDVRLTNLTKPRISGTARVGSVVTASPGTWSEPGVRLAYRWRADGVLIRGTSGPSLQLTLAQEDRRISVRVLASKVGFARSAATSASTSPVEPGVITNTARPTITGDAEVGSMLTATGGTWNPTSTTLSYQWNADGTAIPRATGATLTPDPALLDKALTVTVTASKTGYKSVLATSAATAPVAPGTFTVTGAATVSGSPRYGQTLTFDPGSFTPSDGELSVQWLRGGAPITGATGSTYQLRRADLGTRVSARMQVTKPGYTTLTATTRATRTVKTVARMDATVTSPRAGRVRIRAVVSADGIWRVPGTVRIMVRGRAAQDVTLRRRGIARAVLTGLPSGNRTIRLRYLGSSKVTGVRARSTVAVR
ncbi:MAG TPA: CHAP domain-containing protein [Nocardioidaceae bacterium]|nr:CHAP domain-containing protein [Nocardioidaceae bacterium]